MQVNVNRLSPVLVELAIQLPVDRIQAEVEATYRDVSKTARVKGFRPGKAPAKVIRQVYGKAILSDVQRKLVESSVGAALQEQGLQPLTQPAVESPVLVETQPFEFKARFEVLPAIESVAFEGLEAKRVKAEVTDEQLDSELENIRRQLATVEPAAEGTVAGDDAVLTVDLDVEVDGQNIAEASSKDFPADLSAGNLMAGIKEGLLGKKVGDSAVVELDMPEQHPLASLRGKKAKLTFAVKELKTRVLPQLDDEFAKDLGDFENLEALKADLRGRMQKAADEKSENALAEQLVAALVQKNPIVVPESLVQQQMRITEQEILQQARMRGNQSPRLPQDVMQRVRLDSEVKVRAGLLMAEIAKKEGLTIGQEQIEEALQELAEQSGKNVAKLRAEYREPRQREMLIGMILENKVLDIIEAKAQIADEA